MEVKSAVCWVCCADCHVLAHRENGNVVKITGDSWSHTTYVKYTKPNNLKQFSFLTKNEGEK